MTLKNGNYELLRFPMKCMNITQGNNGQYSHQGVNALDIAGKDTGIEPTFAPCSMRYKWHDSAANGNAIFFESTAPVMFADGTIDYATFMFIHDNYIGDILALANKGHVFAQWEEFGDEGTAGRATGNHCHFEVAKGRYSRPYDGPNLYGVYCLHNSISADKACVVDGVTIKNGNGMAWKKSSEVKTGSSGIKWTAENGTATFTRNNIRIHEDGPTGKVISGVQYNAGQSVRYFAKCAYKGHRWVKYRRANGGIGCVAVSGSEKQGVDPWATFK